MEVLSVEQHQARAMLLGRVYDKLTHTYRYLYPEGSKYKYTDCLHADTLEVMEKGAVRAIEWDHGRTNVVSGTRTPGARTHRPVRAGHPKFGRIVGWE